MEDVVEQQNPSLGEEGESDIVTEQATFVHGAPHQDDNGPPKVDAEVKLLHEKVTKQIIKEGHGVNHPNIPHALVEYDDGDEEVLNLRTEQWEILGDEIPTDIDIFVDKKSPQPRSTTPKREGSTVCEKETSQTNTRNREIMPESEAEVDDGSHQVAEVVEKVKTPEGLSEMKRPRLSDGQKS